MTFWLNRPGGHLVWALMSHTPRSVPRKRLLGLMLN